MIQGVVNTAYLVCKVTKELVDTEESLTVPPKSSTHVPD